MRRRAERVLIVPRVRHPEAREHIKKNHPVLHALGFVFHQIDSNPIIQLRIHTWGFWYWTINFPLVAYLFFFQPGAWAQWGLFITLIYSIYANWTTDLGGIAASQSVINTMVIQSDSTVIEVSGPDEQEPTS